MRWKARDIHFVLGVEVKALKFYKHKATLHRKIFKEYIKVIYIKISITYKSGFMALLLLAIW